MREGVTLRSLKCSVGSFDSFPDTRIQVILTFRKLFAAHLFEEKEGRSEGSVVRLNWIGRCSISDCLCLSGYCGSRVTEGWAIDGK